MKRGYSGVRPAPTPTKPHKPQSKRRLPGILVDAIVLGVILVAGFIISLLPWLRLSTITVSGQQKLNPAFVVDQAQQLLQQRRALVFPQSSYVYADTTGLSTKLTETLRNVLPIEQVSVAKRFPNTLVITIVEQEPVANFVAGEQHFLVDEDGRLTPTPEPSDTVATIADTTDLQFSAGDLALNPVVVNALAEINDLLTARSLGPVSFETPELQCPFDLISPTPQVVREPVNINADDELLENENVNGGVANTNEEPELRPTPLTPTDCDLRALLRDSKEITVNTSDGWSIRLSTAQPVGETLAELFKALNANLRGVALQSVDLRFLPRIIYR